ncbi:helix-turn-helix transcriptional regulator [Amycolatopsis orientalis]|uniref:helix-turn-helix transcriptional regulator n=1 Tax=Amycolatopsis orientalis TaxID=31958 RepID=UPI00040EA9AB|nr:LuxR C-terminal-related transcriptional regulator [Amycolatopsis orientalis]
MRVDDAQLLGAVSNLRRDTGLPVGFAGIAGPSPRMKLTAFLGNRGTALDGLSVRAGLGLGGKALALTRPVVANGYHSATTISHDYDEPVRDEGIHSVVAIPVVVRRRVRAVLYGGLRDEAVLSDRTITAALHAARDLEQTMAVEDEIEKRLAQARPLAEHQEDAAPRERLREVYGELRALAGQVADNTLRARLDEVCENLTGAATAAVRLAPRELDTVALVALGLTNAEIADRLGLTTETVKSYLRDAMRKLDANSRLQAVTYARRLGLLP